MRYFEISSGLRIQISEEESDLLTKAESILEDSSLEERDQEVARKMVSRGLLNRLLKDGKIYYTSNKLEDIWRI